jgi:hypothetical protein
MCIVRGFSVAEGGEVSGAGESRRLTARPSPGGMSSASERSRRSYPMCLLEVPDGRVAGPTVGASGATRAGRAGELGRQQVVLRDNVVCVVDLVCVVHLGQIG